MEGTVCGDTMFLLSCSIWALVICFAGWIATIHGQHVKIKKLLKDNHDLSCNLEMAQANWMAEIVAHDDTKERVRRRYGVRCEVCMDDPSKACDACGCGHR